MKQCRAGVLTLLLVLTGIGPALAAYPSNPPSDVEWPWSSETTVGQIEARFNTARASESPGLPALSLPDQATWDTFTDTDKALWLINAERVDRGVAPLHGAEFNVTSVAQGYADYLMANNAFSHTADGQTPWVRMDGNPVIGACRDFLSVGENLAVLWGGWTLPVERAVYMWMYDDSGSAWGHRHAILWYPYNDNSGPAGMEGFLGIGRATGTHQGWSNSDIVVMNVFDPCSSWDYAQNTLIENLVSDYYDKILDRSPDGAGLAFWRDEILRIMGLGIGINEGFIALAKQFFNSAEYLGKGKSHAAFMADLYDTFLDRAPGQGEVDFWVGRINGGVSRNTVMNFFVFSPEFNAYMDGVFGPAYTRPENNMVNDFYRGILSRLPDSAGFTYWLGRFRAAQCAGDDAAIRSLAYQIASLFLGSAEYTNRGRDHAGYVEDLYDAIMRRDGEPAGVGYWVNGLNATSMNRPGVLGAFTGTTEFQGRVDEVIAAGCAQ